MSATAELQNCGTSEFKFRSSAIRQFGSAWEIYVKQFMALKMVGNALGAAANIVPLDGLMPLKMAEEFLAALAQREPDSVFLIQEVGTA